MKYSKSFKISIACVLILSIVIATGSQLFANAAGYMMGIETVVIEKSNNDKSYTILEIVPTHEDGQLSYLVSGKEPVLLTDRLQEWISNSGTELDNTRQNRIAYVEETVKRLQEQGICADSEAEGKPITYTEYQEKYFLSENENTEDWNKVTFPKDKLETTQLHGRYESSDNGAYRKNIVSFEYVGENLEGSDYVVTFSPMENTVSEERKKFGIYCLRDVTNPELGYRLATDEEISEETSSLFYISEYAYLPEYDGRAYKAVLDEKQPYQYVEKDGDCNFVEAEEEKEVYVEIAAIYYQGGFYNQDWFKNDILKTANNDEKQLNIEVLEKTLDEVQSMSQNELLSIDFVHISGKNGTAYKEKANSLSWDKIVQLFTQIAGQQKTPCMVDSNLKGTLEKENLQSSSFYKLLTLCLQRDHEEIYRQINSSPTKEPNWSTLKNSINSSNNYQWISKNIYSYSSDLIKCWKEPFTENQITDGYKEIKLYIDQENLYRGKNDKLSETITPITCIQYSINFAHKPQEIQSKSKIKVLELQPCKSYTLTPSMVLGWNGAGTSLKEKDITIDQMTTSEFIGKINDLNTEYDLIYIGMNTGAMNTVDGKQTGSTVYNDESMNGLVYTHTGDAMISSVELAGLMDKDYVKNDRSKYLNPAKYNGSYIYALRKVVKEGKITDFKPAITFKSYVDAMENSKIQTTFSNNMGVYRYSGNDITKEKMEELLEYVAANYPVVLADDFYKDPTTACSIINTDKIDNSSYVYDFVAKTIKENYSNVLPMSKIKDSSVFTHYINMPKLGIDFLNSKGEIISESSNNYNESVVTTTKESGRYYINLSFKIRNEMNTSVYTKYVPSFYIDLNADGKFSSKTELFGTNDAIIMDQNGKVISSRDEYGNYLLQSGIAYQLKKELPSSYQSIMTWKLEVRQQSNEYVRTSKVCYTPIKGAGGETETVKVLQIRVDEKWDGGSLANTWDLSADNAFKKLLEETKASTGLLFNLKTQQASDYVKAYNEAKKQGRNYLDEFDMLIIGFADAYMEIEDAGAVEGILNFIKSGKSILFTHDTTSLVNVAKGNYRKQSETLNDMTTTKAWNGNYYWGYNINKYLREIVGMDRYGIMDENSPDNVNDILQKAEIIDLTDSNILNGLNATKDKAYAAGTSKKLAYGETHGYTNHLLDHKRITNADNIYMNLNGLNYSSITNRDIKVQVTQVNKGQITSYPYEIPETFTASSTHYQYYQLDLERDNDNDGESDIVVWYCLGQRSGSNPYAQSPNDVRNSYYIYSIGNVMYSGVGHTKSSEDWERKLFVNTIVAAYKTGVKSPTVSILEDKYIDAEEKNCEYLNFDETLSVETGGAIDKEITLYYSIADSNLVTSSKELSAKYYVGDSDEPIKLTTYTASGKEVSPTKLESGEVYSVTVPVDKLIPYLNGIESANIKVEVTSKFDYYGKATSLTSRNQLTVVKTILQELN